LRIKVLKLDAPACWVCAPAVKAIDPSMSAAAVKVIASLPIRLFSLLW
jgi:hypothetical protein